MKVGEFKKYLEENNISDDMPMGLLDMGSDDIWETNYSLEPQILDSVDEDGEDAGKKIFFIFTNKRAEDWMSDVRGRVEHELEMLEAKAKRLQKFLGQPEEVLLKELGSKDVLEIVRKQLNQTKELVATLDERLDEWIDPPSETTPEDDQDITFTDKDGNEYTGKYKKATDNTAGGYVSIEESEDKSVPMPIIRFIKGVVSWKPLQLLLILMISAISLTAQQQKLEWKSGMRIYAETKDSVVTAYETYISEFEQEGDYAIRREVIDSIGLDTIRITRLYYWDASSGEESVQKFLDYLDVETIGERKGVHFVFKREPYELKINTEYWKSNNK